jgi:hypothetical protein
VRLAAGLARQLPALRERARLLEQAVAKSRARCGLPGASAARTSWSVCAASVLFDGKLFFEAHELLESEWLAAEGDLKIFLQGLIQVAVGCQHHANGNLRGARSLLAEGNEKLRRFRPAVHGVELDEFCAAIDRVLRQLDTGADLAIEMPRLVVQSPSASMR